MNDEALRLSLIEVMNCDLLNDFVNNIFGYELAIDEYVYIQYKIVRGNIVLNIFDNSESNRFKAFVFGQDEFEENDDNIGYINVNTSYRGYKSSDNKLLLLGALLKTNNNDEKKEIINSLFDNGIKEIFTKHFI